MSVKENKCKDCRRSLDMVYAINEFKNKLCLECLGNRVADNKELVLSIKDVEQVDPPFGWRAGIPARTEDVAEIRAEYQFEQCGEIKFKADGKYEMEKIH